MNDSQQSGALTSNEMTADIRRIADTVEQNGGWHIAAVKLRAAADEIDRLRAALHRIVFLADDCGDSYEELCEARDIARAALSGEAASAVETLDDEGVELLTVAMHLLPDPDFEPNEDAEIRLKRARDRIYAYLAKRTAVKASPGPPADDVGPGPHFGQPSQNGSDAL